MSDRLEGNEAAQSRSDGECPAATFVDVHGYRDNAQLVRSAGIRSALSGPDAIEPDVDTKYFRGGSMLRLDGPDHVRRRRVMNRLVRGAGHKWFRDSVLYPTFDQAFAQATSAAEDEVARVDLIPFLLRVNIQLAASVIGLSDVETDQGAEELLRLQKAILLGSLDAALEPRFGLRDQSLLAAGLAAKEEYTELFFKPSLEKHRAMLDCVSAGEMAEEDLPHDLLTLVAATADPEWEDVEIAVRDSLLILRAGVQSSTQAVCNTLEELHTWLADHPEDLQRLADPAFLLAAINETLRLHPNGPYLLRRATQDIHLSDTTVPAGGCAVLRTRECNRDSRVFGTDADNFNPHREIPPGVLPHGMSFGSGPHRCFGISIVLGDEGIDGSLVHIVRALFDAHARPDPHAEPTLEERVHAVHYKSYPVLLDAKR